jgi:hypothetical protein
VVEAAEADPEKFAPLVKEMDRTGKVDGPYKQLKASKASPADIAKADRAEQAAAAKRAAPKSKPAVEQTAAAKPEPKPDEATTTSADLIDLIDQFERINVSATVARMSNDDRITLMTQIVRANSWLNKTAVEVAIHGGANLGKLAPVSLRLEALEFLKAATARIEAELAGRAVATPGAAASATPVWHCI